MAPLCRHHRREEKVPGPKPALNYSLGGWRTGTNLRLLEVDNLWEDCVDVGWVSLTKKRHGPYHRIPAPLASSNMAMSHAQFSRIPW